MKLYFALLFLLCSVFSFAQQKKPNTTPKNKTTQKNKKEDKKDPTPADSTKQKKEPRPAYMYIEVDSTCTRCKGYKYDRTCDGLYCYSGVCSSCKGYQKCIRCAGTQMLDTGLEGCPDCSDGNCRVCKGSGLCAKCGGTGKLPCTLCGGTGKKSPEQIQKERIRIMELRKRRFEEEERKRLYGY